MDINQDSFDVLSPRAKENFLPEADSEDYRDGTYIILDLSDTWCKIGVAGDDSPHLVVPTARWKAETLKIVDYLKSHSPGWVSVGFTVPTFETLHGTFVQDLLRFSFVECGDVFCQVLLLPRVWSLGYGNGRTTMLAVVLTETGKEMHSFVPSFNFIPANVTHVTVIHTNFIHRANFIDVHVHLQ